MSLLQIENLSVQFGALVVLNDLSFCVEQGEVFTIIGPNGAGKSTIFNLISRIYNPASGRILMNAQEITQVKPESIAHYGIARTFQNIELFEHTTVLQNLLMGCHTQCGRMGLNPFSGWMADLLFLPHVRQVEYRHRKAVEDVIDLLDLQPYRDKLISGLPYGVRKMVELGRALAMSPQILLLDEPASGLSREETDQLGFWIEDIQRELGVTLLIIEHNMYLVGLVSDRVMALDQGRCIALGDLDSVRADPNVIEAYLGLPIDNQ